MNYSKRKREKRYNSFVPLARKTLRCQEWKDLSSGAKLLYLHLKSKYNGSNNGNIHLHYSELKGIKGISAPATISKASRELENKRWIKRTKFGGMYRYFNEYELTGKYDDYL